MQTLTLRCTLKPTPEQAAALEATAQRFAEGCNHALRVAKEHGEFRRFKLHRLVYRDLRAMGLSANLAIQAVFRVAKKRGRRAKFYQPTSCAYDQRTLSLRGEAVSLSTVAGRLVIPITSPCVHGLCPSRRGSSPGERARRARAAVNRPGF